MHPVKQDRNIIRTKMGAALIQATHEAIDKGKNTGRLGRLVLTAEAQGVGVKYAPRQELKQQKVAA